MNLPTYWNKICNNSIFSNVTSLLFEIFNYDDINNNEIVLISWSHNKIWKNSISKVNKITWVECKKYECTTINWKKTHKWTALQTIFNVVP